MMRRLVLVLALAVLEGQARADASDLGLADAALAPQDAAAVDALPPAPVVAPSPVLVAPAPPAPAVGRDLRPVHRRPLFWIALVSGGFTVGAIVFGAVWLTHHTPRYAAVSF